MLMLRNHSQKRIFSVYSDEIMQRQHGLQSEVTDVGELTPPRPEVFMITMALIWFEKNASPAVCNHSFDESLYGNTCRALAAMG